MASTYPFVCIVSTDGTGCAFLSEMDEKMQKVLLKNHQRMIRACNGLILPHTTKSLSPLLLEEEMEKLPLKLDAASGWTYRDFCDGIPAKDPEHPVTRALAIYYERVQCLMKIVIDGRKFADPRSDIAVSVIFEP